MRFSIPPQIAWPLAVVALLFTSVVIMSAVIIAARSDGDVQVVPDYYERALEWDATMEQAARNQALGWQVDLILLPAGQQQARLVCSIMDREGRPIEGAQVTVRVSRPELAQSLHEVELTSDSSDGAYFADLVLPKAGLWDFDVLIERGDERYAKKIRRDWSI